MYKSSVFHGNSCIGEVEIYPQNSNAVAAGPWIRELRISHFSPPSERCPPLAVLHTVASGGVRFKMESRSPANDDSPLLALHAACLKENKTAVVSLDEEELHLLAMTSQTNLMRTAYFWGFSVPLRLYDYSLVLLNSRCLGIVFDLDETLIVANTQRSFEDRIGALRRKMNNESDPQRVAGILAEIKRYQDDKYILKQYIDNDQVIDDGKTFKVQSEVVKPLSDNHQEITRPIIRLQEKNIILTRVNPSIRDTSVLVRLRPAWEDLRSYLTARGRKRFEVYVCTMAERDYALEMWRLLDPDSNLIDSTKLLDRIVCVKSGMRKSLHNVFQDGICHPKMTLVVDDRLKVWDERDQPRVHVVPAFAPYYAPQAEASNSIPVLCVARNVACNIRGGFFKEFDEVLLPQISEVLYEDDLKIIQSAPDVGNYLMSEFQVDTSKLNVSRDQQGFDSMTVAKVERISKEATGNIQVVQPTIISYNQRTTSSLQQVMPSSGVVTVSDMQVMMPLPTIQGPQPVSLGKLLGQIVHPEPSFQSSPSREEGEVPDSELDPDTRRRLLILQHGQDTTAPSFLRDPTPPYPVMPSLNITVPPMQQPGAWLPVLEDINPRQVGRTTKDFNIVPETAQYNNKRAQDPSFFRGEENSYPPDTVHEKRRLPFQLNHGGDNVRSNHAASGHNSFPGEGRWMDRTFSCHRLKYFEPGQDAVLQEKSPAVILEEIATKCGTKIEFRSALCDTAELQFLIEVWFVGKKIGEAVGRTRKEAQHQAAEISLKKLADQYYKNSQFGPSTRRDLLKHSKSKENGLVSNPSPYQYETYTRGDMLPVTSTLEDSCFMTQRLDNSKGASFVSSLRELCIMEGLNLDFQIQPPSSSGLVNEGQVSAQVEISGQVLGRGIGSTWDEAKHRAAEEALEALMSTLGQFTQNQSNLPRSLTTFPNKRSKPDFSHVLH